MRSLRVQLLASHVLVLLMMLAVMMAAVLSFFRLGRSIDRILEDNYRSVVAVQRMQDALARHDSAATLYLAGQPEKARAQLAEARTDFLAAHHVEANNITEQGEQRLSDDLGREYEVYARSLARMVHATPPVSRDEARRVYVSDLEPAAASLKELARGILDLNQAAMQRADRKARAEARRASWGALATTLAASALALVVALRTVRVALRPLLDLARQAERVGAGQLDLAIEARRSDEVGVLAAEFARMVERLRDARRLEEQRLHRAQRMSDDALESLYDPVVVTDAAGRVAHLNRAAQSLFGSAESTVGRPAAEVVGAGQVAHAIEQAVRRERVTAAEDEAGLTTLAGAEGDRVYRVRTTPMRDHDGSLLGAVAVLEDVTRLREVDRLKTEFIGVASHELRTPVASLVLSAQILLEGAAGPLTDAQREVVEAQRVDIERLERTTQDLLDITRMESGRHHPAIEEVRAGDIARAAVDAVAALADARGVVLEANLAADATALRADRSQLTRALTNLLTNAVRHTPEGGHVALSATAASDERPGVSFEVRDTGPGIPPEYLPRIFDRFVQVPGTSGGGAGLGLAIARSIVRAHGGDITAESVAGSGSTFRATVPVEPDGWNAREAQS